MMAKAFYTWRTVVADMVRQQQMLRRSLGKFVYRAQAMAWAKWVEYVEQKKSAEKNARRAMARWINRELARAFLRWREWYADLKDQILNLKRALLRWQKTLLSRAFQTWYANTAGRPKFDGFERAARHFMNFGLGRAFNTWRGVAKALCARDAMLDKMNNRFSSETMSLMEQLQAALRRIKELEELLASMGPQSQNLDADLDAAEAARRRAEAELAAARKRLNDLMGDKNSSKADLERALRDLKRAEEELRKANDLIEKLRARIRELEEELRRLRAEMARKLSDNKKANDEWLSEQARRKAQEEEEARRRREEAERKRRADSEENARRRELLKAQEGEHDSNLLRRSLAHWLYQSMTRAFNKVRDEAAHLRRIEMIMRRVALRWKKDKAYKLLVKLRDYAEAKRIKDLEFQAYLTKTKTSSPTSRKRTTQGAYVSPFGSPTDKSPSII
jgi:myosin heavy subunit